MEIRAWKNRHLALLFGKLILRITWTSFLLSLFTLNSYPVDFYYAVDYASPIV